MPQPVRQHGSRRASGFTLIELLVVIGIIGVLFLLVLPSFENLGGTSRLDAAAGNLDAAIRLARQHAIVQHQPTYVLFQDDASTADPAKQFRAYAVFAIDAARRPVGQSNGVFIADWRPLPEGTVFDPGADGANLFAVAAEPWNGGFNANRQIAVRGTNYVALGFDPTGLRTDPVDIYLAEGFFDKGRLVLASRQCRRLSILASGATSLAPLLYDERDQPQEPEN